MPVGVSEAQHVEWPLDKVAQNLRRVRTGRPCVLLATGALMELRSEAAFWHKATNSSSIQQETNTMNDTYMDLTIAISESGVPYRGAWAASLVPSVPPSSRGRRAI